MNLLYNITFSPASTHGTIGFSSENKAVQTATTNTSAAHHTAIIMARSIMAEASKFA